MNDEAIIFSGSANPVLGQRIALEMNVTLGRCTVEHFPDGETSVRLEESVRGREVFVIQPTGPPVNEHLIELLIFADACRRDSAKRITAIVPYFGYARADKRGGNRLAVTASMVAGLLESAGVDHVVTVDAHAPQLEGFFHIPVDDLTAVDLLANAVRARLPGGSVVVSPDAGRVKAATEFSHHLGAPVAVLHKRRKSSTETSVTHLVGDVRDRTCLIIDDMISTGGTIVESIEALLKAGARPGFFVAATHGLLTDGAKERLAREPVRELFLTDTLSIDESAAANLRIVSVAPLLAQALRVFIQDGSLQSLC